jgi:hypothetical protein
MQGGSHLVQQGNNSFKGTVSQDFSRMFPPLLFERVIEAMDVSVSGWRQDGVINA